MFRTDNDEEIARARISDRRRVASVVLRGLLTAVFLVAAGMKFAAVPFEARFGYPL
jgi:putative oxidoreductase